MSAGDQSGGFTTAGNDIQKASSDARDSQHGERSDDRQFHDNRPPFRYGRKNSGRRGGRQENTRDRGDGKNDSGNGRRRHHGGGMARRDVDGSSVGNDYSDTNGRRGDWNRQGRGREGDKENRREHGGRRNRGRFRGQDGRGRERRIGRSEVMEQPRVRPESSTEFPSFGRSTAPAATAAPFNPGARSWARVVQQPVASTINPTNTSPVTSEPTAELGVLVAQELNNESEQPVQFGAGVPELGKGDEGQPGKALQGITPFNTSAALTDSMPPNEPLHPGIAVAATVVERPVLWEPHAASPVVQQQQASSPPIKGYHDLVHRDSNNTVQTKPHYVAPDGVSSHMSPHATHASVAASLGLPGPSPYTPPMESLQQAACAPVQHSMNLAVPQAAPFATRGHQPHHVRPPHVPPAAVSGTASMQAQYLMPGVPHYPNSGMFSGHMGPAMPPAQSAWGPYMPPQHAHHAAVGMGQMMPPVMQPGMHVPNGMPAHIDMRPAAHGPLVHHHPGAPLPHAPPPYPMHPAPLHQQSPYSAGWNALVPHSIDNAPPSHHHHALQPSAPPMHAPPPPPPSTQATLHAMNQLRAVEPPPRHITILQRPPATCMPPATISSLPTSIPVPEVSSSALSNFESLHLRDTSLTKEVAVPEEQQRPSRSQVEPQQYMQTQQCTPPDEVPVTSAAEANPVPLPADSIAVQAVPEEQVAAKEVAVALDVQVSTDMAAAQQKPEVIIEPLAQASVVAQSVQPLEVEAVREPAVPAPRSWASIASGAAPAPARKKNVASVPVVQTAKAGQHNSGNVQRHATSVKSTSVRTSGVADIAVTSAADVKEVEAPPSAAAAGRGVSTSSSSSEALPQQANGSVQHEDSKTVTAVGAEKTQDRASSPSPSVLVAKAATAVLGGAATTRTASPIDAAAPSSQSMQALQRLSNMASTSALHDITQRLPPRGLVNAGNLCFMNATLQALMGASSFCHLLQTLRQLDGISAAQDTPTLGAFSLLASEYEPLINLQGGSHSSNGDVPASKDDKHMNGKSSQLGRGSAINPTMLMSVLKEFIRDHAGPGAVENEGSLTMAERLSRRNPEAAFAGKLEQQDAQEFFTFLFDRAHQELVRLHGSQSRSHGDLNGVQEVAQEEEQGDGEWITMGKKNRTAVTRGSDLFEGGETAASAIFGGGLQSTVRCHGAKPSETVQPFTVLHLDIHPDRVLTIQDALELFTAPETIHGYKSKGGEETHATKFFRLRRLPLVMVLHLKRFTWMHGTGKLHKTVKFDKMLRLQPQWLADARPGVTYELIATVSHHGRTPSSGHYTADVQQADKKWLRFDDATVSYVSESEVFSSKVYLLFYQMLPSKT